MDDLISRQAAIDFIKDHSYSVRYDGNSIEQGMTITGIEQALNEVPSIQPKQTTGRWSNAEKYCGEFVCTNCNMLCYTNKYRYCPNCGAIMENGYSDNET